MLRSKKPSSRTGAFESVLAKGLEIEGTLFSKGSLRIDGKVKGKVESEGDVMVGQNGLLNAAIKAVNVTIAGNVIGNVKCTHRLELLASGKLTGDVTVGSLVVSEGATFSGASQMKLPENMKEPVSPQTAREG